MKYIPEYTVDISLGSPSNACSMSSRFRRAASQPSYPQALVLGLGRMPMRRPRPAAAPPPARPSNSSDELCPRPAATLPHHVVRSAGPVDMLRRAICTVRQPGCTLRRPGCIVRRPSCTLRRPSCTVRRPVCTGCTGWKPVPLIIITTGITTAAAWGPIGGTGFQPVAFRQPPAENKKPKTGDENGPIDQFPVSAFLFPASHFFSVLLGTFPVTDSGDQA